MGCQLCQLCQLRLIIICALCTGGHAPVHPCNEPRRMPACGMLNCYNNMIDSAVSTLVWNQPGWGPLANVHIHGAPVPMACLVYSIQSLAEPFQGQLQLATCKSWSYGSPTPSHRATGRVFFIHASGRVTFTFTFTFRGKPGLGHRRWVREAEGRDRRQWAEGRGYWANEMVRRLRTADRVASFYVNDTVAHRTTTLRLLSPWCESCLDTFVHRTRILWDALLNHCLDEAFSRTAQGWQGWHSPAESPLPTRVHCCTSWLHPRPTNYSEKHGTKQLNAIMSMWTREGSRVLRKLHEGIQRESLPQHLTGITPHTTGRAGGHIYW